MRSALYIGLGSRHSSPGWRNLRVYTCTNVLSQVVSTGYLPAKVQNHFTLHVRGITTKRVSLVAVRSSISMLSKWRHQTCIYCTYM
jgi:hypothetical protein